MLVRAPWLMKQPHVVNSPVDFSDVFPTLLELAGIAPPKDARVDGRSLVPLLRGDARPEQQRAWIFSERGKNRTVRDERFKLDSSGKFWDLQSDPLEANDLSQSTVEEVVNARRKLMAVLHSLPADGPPPFEGFLKVPGPGKAE